MTRSRLLSSMLLLASITFAQQPTEEGFEERDTAREREKWFADQRGFKPGNAKGGLRLKALDHLDRMRKDEKSRRDRLSAAPQGATAAADFSLMASAVAWSSIGPTPLTGVGYTGSGRMATFAVDPRDPQVMYAGGAVGGVWKTLDGGTTWRPLTDFSVSLSTGAIALDPTNPDIVYVGTGEYTGYFGAGILKSTDGGQNWTNIRGPFMPNGAAYGYRIAALAVSPRDGRILLVGSPGNLGVQRSADGGATWTQVSPAWVHSIVFDPNSPDVVYAGTSYGSVLKSTNAGQTWATVHTNSFNTADRAAVAIGAADSSVYVAYGIGDNAYLYRSRDAGATWTQRNNQDPNGVTNLCRYQCWWNLTIAVSPVNSNHVFFGGVVPYRSLDGGVTWSYISGTHVDQHAAMFNATGDRLIVANDGGMWRLDNFPGAPPTFAGLNQTLSTIQFYPGISIAEGNPNIMLGGTQDNASNLYGGTPDWEWVGTGDGFSTAIDPTNPRRMWVTSQNGLIQRTDTGDQFYTAKTNGLPQSSQFETLLTIDPSNPSRLYTAFNGTLFRTDNAGDTWSAVSTFNFCCFGGVTVSPHDPNVIYLPRWDTRVSITRNALSGAPTWTTVTLPVSRTVLDVEVDPFQAGTAYAVIGGYNADDAATRQGHVFRLSNYGASVTRVDAGLPDIPVTDIVADPDVPNALYIATDVGVFSSSDGGASWNSMVQNLPRTVVTGLVIERQSRILRAGTHGRGMWEIQLPGVPNRVISLSPTSLSFPTQEVKSVSPAATVTVTNQSTSTVTVSGAVSQNFWIQSTTCGSLAPGQSCAYQVSFAPVSAGTLGGTLTVTAGSDTQRVALSGTAVATPPPCTLAPANSVTICTPADGGTTASPVRIIAATNTNLPVKAMRVYVDSQSQYLKDANRIDISLPMSAGTHRITVNAWDLNDAVISKSITVTVGSGSACVAPSTAPTPSVTICTPSDGASVTSPFRLAAATKSATPVTAMKVYVDGALTFSTSASSIDTQIAAAAGTRKVTVNAWNSAGQVFKQTIYVTVGSGGGGTCTLSTTDPSVTICEPAANATVSSPVRIIAKTTSSSAVTAMKVYVDGVLKYSTSASSVDTSLAMAAGTRRISVNAWNSKGQVFTKTIYVTVASGGSTCTVSTVDPSVTICEPAANATVSSPVRVIAKTTSSSAVTAMKVYVDGVLKYSTSASSVDISLAMAAGTRRISVNAWNSSGQVFTRTIYVTVQ